ncbi:PBP1A family penicillin-binding protein [candidate division WWE3 bacterium]|nr:PBP1A family penicillin-binding protein [candidate division WWE3 bacterium]
MSNNFKSQKRRLRKWLNPKSVRSTYSAKQKRLRILSLIAGITLILIIAGLITVFGVIAYFSKDLPSPDRLSTRNVPQSTKIFSRDGVLLYEIFGDERRTLVELKDIPQTLRDAAIAVEDKDFYNHRGFDVLGIARAAFRVARGENLQSGSTITQQVVKNTLLTPERTMTRKIKELILSIELERKYTKDQILQMYFNEVPYGGQAWGAGAAAEMFFGKHVRDLTSAEATYIAGLPQSPTYYSPCGAYPENAKGRQKTVLRLMVENQYLTQEQADEIYATEVQVVCQGNSADDIKAPHFVMYVKSLLTEMFGDRMVEQGGLRVTTTLDWNKQQTAQEEVKKQVDALQKAKANASNAGMISVDPTTGQILAMVGSVDYYDTAHDGNVNVMLAQRQPGSSMKPLTYLDAFSKGYSPSTFVSDIKTCFPGGAGQPEYCPKNWDDKFWGPMSVRTALANSRNIPAVKMLQVITTDELINFAHQLGITTLNERDRYGLSLTLGGGEVRPIDLAQVYSVFAALGQKHDLTPLMKVEDSTGKVLNEYKDTSREVVKPEYTYLLNDVLSDADARRPTFGNSLDIGRKLAVKTGTTNDNRDAWTIGYTPQIVTLVWVGNFDNSPMNGIMGSTGATPIMKAYMRRVLEGIPSKDWDRPANVTNKVVDALSGMIPQDGKGYPTRNEIFAKGSEPTQVDDFHSQVEVCKSDPFKKATDFHKVNELSETRTFTYLKEINSAWQTYTNEWMSSRLNEGWGKPPTEMCSISIDGNPLTKPYIQIDSPAAGTKLTTTSFPVSAKVYSQQRITKVNFAWDDAPVESVTSQPFSVTYDLEKLDTEARNNGTHLITITAFDSEGEESSISYEVQLELANQGGILGDIITIPPYVSVVPTKAAQPTIKVRRNQFP